MGIIMKFRTIAKAAIVGAALIAGAVQAKQVYTFTNLSAVSPGAYWNAINNSGNVVGWNDTGLVYQSGTVTEIDPGQWGKPIFNNHGDIAMRLGNGSTVLYSQTGSRVAIPELYPAIEASDFDPIAINDKGMVAGSTYCYGPGCAQENVATLYAGGTTTNLGTLGGNSSQALAINNLGHVAGTSKDASGNNRAFIYANGKMEAVNLSGANKAVGLNDAGQILVSTSAFGGPNSPWIYDHGTTTGLSLGVNGTMTGVDLNNRGEAIGTAVLDSDWNGHSWLYTDGRTWDLNELVANENWIDISVRDLNDRGQILAEARFTDGTSGFILLSPDAMPPVPEPGTYAMLLAGLGIIAARRLRRRAG
jgi:probable HAF family extracellular repeat protein